MKRARKGGRPLPAILTALLSGPALVGLSLALGLALSSCGGGGDDHVSRHAAEPAGATGTGTKEQMPPATANASAAIEAPGEEEKTNEAPFSSMTAGALLLLFAGMGLVIVLFVYSGKKSDPQSE